MNLPNEKANSLPGFNCGLCGAKTCTEFASILQNKPDEIKRCIHLHANEVLTKTETFDNDINNSCKSCSAAMTEANKTWKDTLGRDFDFILDTFPNDPGPREIIVLHNPARVKELDVKKGEILIGRPMGMSCGCPITHCGVVTDIDYVNGVISWCVTGPLNPRCKAHKDIGYYSAQAYEGIVNITQKELKIGMRYWFLPHRCMLQWRHSGLVNFLNKGKNGMQVRIEGLYIG